MNQDKYSNRLVYNLKCILPLIIYGNNWKEEILGGESFEYLNNLKTVDLVKYNEIKNLNKSIVLLDNGNFLLDKYITQKKFRSLINQKYLDEYKCKTFNDHETKELFTPIKGKYLILNGSGKQQRIEFVSGCHQFLQLDE